MNGKSPQRGILTHSKTSRVRNFLPNQRRMKGCHNFIFWRQSNYQQKYLATSSACLSGLFLPRFSSLYVYLLLNVKLFNFLSNIKVERTIFLSNNCFIKMFFNISTGIKIEISPTFSEAYSRNSIYILRFLELRKNQKYQNG